MSIKKLGGIRLRLIIGMMAVLAIFGIVLGFAPKRTESILIDPSSVVGGEALAFVELSGLNDEQTYWIVPTVDDDPTFDIPTYRGLVVDDEQDADPFTYGFVFVSDYAPAPDAIKINGPDADAYSDNGELFLPLQTQEVLVSGQVLDIELRADGTNGPDGTKIDEDDLTILTQD